MSPAPVSLPREPRLVVGVGASAGGLEALERFFRATPVDSGMAFVVIQHLSPDYKSLMDELLARFTSIAVVKVHEPVAPAADTIYLLPPNKELSLVAGRLALVERQASLPPAPINRFFSVMAESFGDRCAGVVLSGTGSDGTLGIADIHERGGLVLVQREDTAKFDGMPRSAIATGLAHAVLAPEDMLPVLVRYAQNPDRDERAAASTPSSVEPSGAFVALLHRLRTVAGIDFAAYKPSTIQRRVERRVLLHGYPSLAAYVDAVALDREELAALHSDLLICVTRFFRDPEVFELLAREVLPGLIDGLSPGVPLRIWVPACATGEEAYSLAFLVLAALAARGRGNELKIFATDVHVESLRVASEGVFGEEAVMAVPEALREAFFAREADGRYRVIARVRRAIVFSSHNLLRDVPFNRVDLVSCRNALIYFDTAAQARALGALQFALKLGGVLVLGPSESVSGFEAQLAPIDRAWNVYRKTADAAAAHVSTPTTLPVPGPRLSAGEQRLVRIYDRLLERFAPPSVLVNERREVVHVFGAATAYLRQPAGRPTLDLSALALPELRGPMTVAISRAQRDRESVAVREVQVELGGARQVVDVIAEPFGAKGQEGDHVLVQLVARVVAEAPLAVTIGATDAVERLHQLEDELSDTRASLNQIVEELEATNEELQASNEELIASNEELQSTNEELHAVNEELYSVNSEHEQKIRALAATTADLQNLMNASHVGVIFLDERRRIRMFTHGAIEMLNLRPHDVGRPITDITSRIADDRVFDDLDAVALTGQPVEAEVRVAADRWLLRRVVRYRDADKVEAGFVMTLVDMTQRKLVEVGERAARDLLQAAIDATPARVAMIDPRGGITALNRAWRAMSSRALSALGVPTAYAERADALVADVLAGRADAADLDYSFADGATRRWYWMNVNRLPIAQGGAVVTHSEITERVQMDATNALLAAIVASSADAIVGLDAGDRVTSWNHAAEAMFGATVAEVRGLGMSAILPADILPQYSAALARVRASESVTGLEVRGTNRAGRALDAVLSLSPVHEAGQVIGVAIVATDMRALRQAAREQRRLEQKLAEAARLESLGVLAGGIAHDFNNLLAAILGNLEFARAESDPGAPGVAALADAIAAAGVAAQLSRQMLAYSGRGPLVQEDVALAGVVEQSLAIVRHSLGKHATIVWHGDADAPVHVLGDRAQLHQVAMNLIINALEAIPEAGAVRIAVRRVPAVAELEPRTEGFAQLVVEDDGPGIAAEHLGRVFEPFFTTKFTGRGLGLSVVQGIVKAHGGDVALSSRPGATCFTVTLPALVSAPRVPSTGAAPRPVDASGPARSVLVVDDEQLVRRALGRLLGRVGHTCVLAASGAEAVEVLAREPGAFDIVLLDVTMPGLHGLELVARLRELNPDLPIVLMSGYGASSLTPQQLSLVDGFLMKPVDHGKLVAAVRDLGGRASRPD